MMNCRIILETNSGNFFPGDVIKGRLVCEFSNPEQVKGIKIKFRGREHTTFTKIIRRYNNSTKRTTYTPVSYNGNNKFIQVELDIVDEGSIGPGTFEYPFQVDLPNQCASSYETTNGKIWYYIKATVDLPWAPNYENIVNINVVSHIDLNTIPDLIMIPITHQDEEEFICCCYAGGPLTMDLNLNKQAFILGEVMRLQIYILNMSDDNITNLHVQLIQHIKASATSPKKDCESSEVVIAKLEDTGVGAHGERDYNLLLRIPADAELPNFALSSLFQSRCSLKVEAAIPSFASKLKMDIEIILGHVPLVTGVGTDGIDLSAPPYPGNRNEFPVPNFPSLHKQEVLNVHTPCSFASSSVPPLGPSTDPSVEDAPSVPPEATLADEEDFEVVDGGNRLGQPSSREPPPPPSYFDAVDSK